MPGHRFGGAWTEKKLERLGNYLTQYRRIFTKHEGAKHLKTIYLDAFAGTGERVQQVGDGASMPLFEQDAEAFLDGSAKIALALESPFDGYVFIDSKASHIRELRAMIDADFPALAARCEVHKTDANSFLIDWCTSQEWRRQRAVVFLDPYGTDVKWATIEAIANTKAIDLWILFPAMAASRIMPTKGTFGPGWEDRLTDLLGDSGWKDALCTPRPEVDLFGGADESVKRTSDLKDIGGFFNKRLSTIFPGVAPVPEWLYNNSGSPLFLLCFAAGNEKGAPTAVRIAQHLLNPKVKSR